MKLASTSSALLAAAAATAALVAAAAAGCTVTNTTTADGGAPASDGGTPEAGDAGDAGDEPNECVTYAAATIGGKKTGVFASADVVRIPLPPTDQGGGLLKVTYKQTGSVVGSIFLPEGPLAADPRTETSAFGPGVTNDQPVVVTYRLAGKRTYELGVKPFVFDDTKADYEVEYAYEPLADCYEPNDDRAAARRIPVNTAITAFHHAGLGVEDTSTASVTGDDWYAFELASPKTVKLKATLPGKDGAAGGNPSYLRLYAADGATTPSCPDGRFETDPVAPSEAVETCEGELPAGRYYVHLALFVGQATASAANASFNRSWNTSYSFTVEAK